MGHTVRRGDAGNQYRHQLLITFAQYEREVITERVRDKMAASRKKGKWVGGSVPMGYRVENKKLTIVEEEARIIQRIFQRFIEIQSPTLIAQELNKDGIRTKQGKAWDKPHIYRILNLHWSGQIQRIYLRRGTRGDC